MYFKCTDGIIHHLVTHVELYSVRHSIKGWDIFFSPKDDCAAISTVIRVSFIAASLQISLSTS